MATALILQEPLRLAMCHNCIKIYMKLCWNLIWLESKRSKQVNHLKTLISPRERSFKKRDTVIIIITGLAMVWVLKYMKNQVFMVPGKTMLDIESVLRLSTE